MERRPGSFVEDAGGVRPNLSDAAMAARMGTTRAPENLAAYRPQGEQAVVSAAPVTAAPAEAAIINQEVIAQ